MAVTRGTLRIARRLRRDIGSEVDGADRALTAAWVKEWDGLASAWHHASADLVAEAGRLGHWPRPTDIARLPRVMAALDRSEEALGDLSGRTGELATAAANTVIDADVELEPRIIASQAPATEREGLLAHVSGRLVAEQDREQIQLLALSRIRTDAVDVIRNRAAGQITSDLLPLSDEASEAMRRELIRGVDVGANPREAASRMVNAVEGRFNGGLTRALTIARTETLDAYRATSQQIHAANSDVVPGWEWLAELDLRTCFPAGTLATTRRGDVPIESVRVGDKVLTHTGQWRCVYETMSRAHRGPMVTVEAGPLRVTATADHPFLVERQGRLHWIEARHIRAGDQILTDRQRRFDGVDHAVGEDPVERGGGQANDQEPVGSQEEILLGIPLGDLGVPVGFVDFEGYTEAGKYEVHRPGPSGDCRLLDVLDPEVFQGEADIALRNGLAGMAPVATLGAEASLLPFARSDAEPGAAEDAGVENGGSPALLGAVAVVGSLRGEDLFAPSAGAADGVRPAARVRAVGVPAGVAACDSEVLPAARACLSHLAALPALPGAGASWSGSGSQEVRPAVLTVPEHSRSGGGTAPAVRVLPLVSGVAGAGAELARALPDPRLGDLELGATPLASPLHRLTVSRTTSQIQSTRVYNMEVDEDHSYVANGFAVHNCPSCWAMDGRQFPSAVPGPDDHPQGRCARIPVLAPWAELGITAPEPPSAWVDAEERFWALPEADRLRIMGPGRLRLLEERRIGFGELSTLRQNPGWRPSRVPTSLRALQQRAAGGAQPRAGQGATRSVPATPGPQPSPRISSPTLPIPDRPLTGQAALDAAPAGLDRVVPGGIRLTRTQRSALEDYESSFFSAVNGQLRRGEVGAAVQRSVNAIDEVMRTSRLTADVVAYRGIADVDAVFGTAGASRSLVGARWTERGYQSWTVERRVADEFAGPGPNPAILRITAPRGTSAVRISGLDTRGRQGELLLSRGLRPRVTADTGPGSSPRVIDVELAPARARPRAAPPRTPASVRQPGRDLGAEITPATFRALTARAAAQSGYGDHVLTELTRLQPGWDNPAQLVAKARLDTAVEQGWTELWRGLTSSRFAAQMRTGDWRMGTGIYGDGVYTSTRRTTAEFYRGSTLRDPDGDHWGPGNEWTGGFDVPEDAHGGLVRMAIDPNARLADWHELKDEWIAWLRQQQNHPWFEEAMDFSWYAINRGYDGVVVRGRAGINDGSPYPPGVHNTAEADQYVIFNRSVLMIERASGRYDP